MRAAIRYGLWALLLASGVMASAPAPTVLAQDLAVVVHPDIDLNALSRNDLINIFMGRYQQLPDGRTAFPLDLRAQREAFYRKLVNKSPAELRSYWARLVFSGRGSPPRELRSDDEVIQVVSSNPGAVGYLEADQVDSRVRVVHVLRD